MADSLNPLENERFPSIKAAAHDGDLSDAEALPEELGAPEEHWETLGDNGRHPLSGPLAPLAAPGALAGNAAGRRKTLPVILGVVGVLVIVGCLGVGAIVTLNLFSLQNNLNSPQTTLDAFYSALHVHDYQTAYDQLSSGYQHRLTQDSFRASFELTGTLDSYQISNLQTQSDQASATVKVTVINSGAGMTVDETKSVQLVLEGENWKINRVNPSLTNGTGLSG